jgi:transcriptional regulator with XRE-family HTH domain
MMHWQRELGGQIREARKAAGISQERLAETLSVTREQLSNYENGKSAPPVNVVTEIIIALRVEFVVGGCRISLDGLKQRSPQPIPQQLCFAYDTEHRFSPATVTIKPTEHSIHISAVIPRSRLA